MAQALPLRNDGASAVEAGGDGKRLAKVRRADATCTDYWASLTDPTRFRNSCFDSPTLCAAVINIRSNTDCSAICADASMTCQDAYRDRGADGCDVRIDNFDCQRSSAAHVCACVPIDNCAGIACGGIDGTDSVCENGVGQFTCVCNGGWTDGGVNTVCTPPGGFTTTSTTTITTTTVTTTTTTALPGCSTAADVVFLVDESGSVGAANFATMLDFVQEVMLTFDQELAHVGVVTFGVGATAADLTGAADLRIPLGPVSSSTYTAVANIPYGSAAGTQTKSGFLAVTEVRILSSPAHSLVAHGTPHLGPRGSR